MTSRDSDSLKFLRARCEQNGDPVQHVQSLRENQDLKKLNFTSCVVITGQYTDFNKQRTWCYVAHSQLGLAPPLKTNCNVDRAETVLSYLHTLFTTHCNCKYMWKYFTSQLRKPSALVRYGTHKQTHKAEMWKHCDSWLINNIWLWAQDTNTSEQSCCKRCKCGAIWSPVVLQLKRRWDSYPLS